jgi:hypothetical protein
MWIHIVWLGHGGCLVRGGRVLAPMDVVSHISIFSDPVTAMGVVFATKLARAHFAYEAHVYDHHRDRCVLPTVGAATIAQSQFNAPHTVRAMPARLKVLRSIAVVENDRVTQETEAD